MAKTLLQIRNDVRTYLDESTEADWLDAELNRMINKAYHRVVTAVIDVYENYYITESTTDLGADQQEYNLPSDFWKIRRVEINYDIASSATAFNRAYPVDLDQVRFNLANRDIGVGTLRSPAYYLQGDIIGFLPIPPSAGTNALKIWYVKTQSDLTEDTDTVNIPYADRYYSIISKAVAAEAMRKGQQEIGFASDLEREAQKDLEKMQRELEDRIAEEGKRVIDTSGDLLDFGNPGA